MGVGERFNIGESTQAKLLCAACKQYVQSNEPHQCAVPSTNDWALSQPEKENKNEKAEEK
jgi:hypothetical protein